jgi:hypothetical protein
VRLTASSRLTFPPTPTAERRVIDRFSIQCKPSVWVVGQKAFVAHLGSPTYSRRLGWLLRLCACGFRHGWTIGLSVAHLEAPGYGRGLLELEHNADHLRSQLVRLTELGRAKYAAIDR